MRTIDRNYKNQFERTSTANGQRTRSSEQWTDKHEKAIDGRFLHARFCCEHSVNVVGLIDDNDQKSNEPTEKWGRMTRRELHTFSHDFCERTKKILTV